MVDPRFRRGPGGVSSLGLHVVWCPKYRRRLLGGRVAARRLKGATSRVLRAEFPWLGPKRVSWSKSYFVASVGYVSEPRLRRYIEHQWDAA